MPYTTPGRLAKSVVYRWLATGIYIRLRLYLYALCIYVAAVVYISL